jgi:hypothetical protein
MTALETLDVHVNGYGRTSRDIADELHAREQARLAEDEAALEQSVVRLAELRAELEAEETTQRIYTSAVKQRRHVLGLDTPQGAQEKRGTRRPRNPATAVTGPQDAAEGTS